MTQYKGLYIDNIFFHSKSEIDEAVKQREIARYRLRCENFLIHRTLEASMFADEQADRLHDEFGITWEELEHIEEEVCENF